MYAGPLDMAAIFDEIRIQLKVAGADTRASYEAYLVQGGGYATIVLSDTSVWILRFAANKPEYVHLHPGRYSPHTFRVKAAALKTALAYWVSEQQGLPKGNLLEDLNALRAGLKLSPLRSVSESGHIREIMVLLGCKAV